MLNVWVLVDTTYLCHRARHTTGGDGGLEYDGRPTGIAFGVLRTINDLMDTYSPHRMVLAFDHQDKGLREQILPTYKSSRASRKQELTEEERAERQSFYEQVNRLQNDILPKMGYNNVLSVSGYEADDIIAALAEKVPNADKGVIVSGDKDLYQCLQPHICMYHPITKVTVTSASFRKEYGIDPVQWAGVKALAGCSTDDVVGIRGVGDKTAARWFSGDLKVDSKKYKAISENLDVHNRNLPIVKLPFPGLKLPKIVADNVTEASKAAVERELGIRASRISTKAKEKMRKMRGFDI